MRRAVARRRWRAAAAPVASGRRPESGWRTRVLGVAALASTGAVIGTELWRVARRRSAEELVVDDPVEEMEETARATVEVAVAGYQSGSTRENTLMNMLVSFTLTFGLVRLSTSMIRRSNAGRWGPFRNVVIGRSHVHHFVPGIVIAFLSGGASILLRGEELDRWLAIPFGAGAALTLDESALLLRLDDVYWTEEGIVSVQVTLAAMLMLSALAVVLRVLRRGEQVVSGGSGGG